MPLALREIQCRIGDLALDVDLSLHGGMLVALAGPNGSGKTALLEIAAGLRQPDSGEVVCRGRLEIARASLDSADPSRIRRSIDDALALGPDVLLIGAGFSLCDPDYQARTLSAIDAARRRGMLTFVISHDLVLPARHCDEVVLMEAGRVVDRGDPRSVLDSYRDRLESRRRAESGPSTIAPTSRHGDGRAEISDLQMIDSGGKAVGLIRNGEAVSARVRVRYLESVADPVIGILIRSRVGVNVYGTNTELENVAVGPCAADDEIELNFRFNAALCAQDYTLTAASHDPDGTAHEWLEDAIAFTVTATRYAAGVADLQAQVEVKRVAGGEAGRTGRERSSRGRLFLLGLVLGLLFCFLVVFCLLPVIDLERGRVTAGSH